MANLFLHFLLCDRNLKLIGWSARGFDGLLHNTEAMAGGMRKSIQPGAIILLHEGRRGPGRGVRSFDPGAKPFKTRLTADGYIPDGKDFL